ncbi:MAG: hypothetical protein JST12_07465 [Armatimonadetes bacterium]|nr:hypothetical protein [Armatimonadota bacterium]MBS1725465.1 hypothetical protein [Armatimonadota bacterium]
MRRVALVVLVLSVVVGCGEPPDLTAVKPTYKGYWRTGTSKDNYMVMEIYQDNSVNLFGTRQDMQAPGDLQGDKLTVDAGKATMKGHNYSADPNAKFPFDLKRVSDKKIEITDESGQVFGVNTPLEFDKMSSDDQDSTNAAIMQRAMNGG